jgi:hypothetical protein
MECVRACICEGARMRKQRFHLKPREQSSVGLRVLLCGVALFGLFPLVAYATHEADHRFMVEGYVCGSDGKGLTNTDVLVKDTKISYGQVVKTDGDGYYKAMFHLHNDNFGDPLLVEAKGEQQNLKVEFDQKDLESERKVRVNFGTGCESGGSSVWLWWGSGLVVLAACSLAGMKLLSSQQKPGSTKGKSQTKKRT